MLNDRYMPADASDEYELTREDSGRHSHKHDRKHKKSKKEKKHREGSTERHRHSENKNETEHAAKRPSKHHPADELEDGEIMEDGEVLDAAVVQPTTEGILDSNRTGIDDVSPCQRRWEYSWPCHQSSWSVVVLRVLLLLPSSRCRC